MVLIWSILQRLYRSLVFEEIIPINIALYSNVVLYMTNILLMNILYTYTVYMYY